MELYSVGLLLDYNATTTDVCERAIVREMHAPMLSIYNHVLVFGASKGRGDKTGRNMCECAADTLPPPSPPHARFYDPLTRGIN